MHDFSYSLLTHPPVGVVEHETGEVLAPQPLRHGAAPLAADGRLARVLGLTVALAHVVLHAPLQRPPDGRDPEVGHALRLLLAAEPVALQQVLQARRLHEHQVRLALLGDRLRVTVCWCVAGLDREFGITLARPRSKRSIWRSKHGKSIWIRRPTWITPSTSHSGTHT